MPSANSEKKPLSGVFGIRKSLGLFVVSLGAQMFKNNIYFMEFVPL